MAFCSSCGNKLEDGARFCPGCGSAVNQKMQESMPTAGESSEKVILEAKGSGCNIALTDKRIMWSKKVSVANFIAAGVLSAAMPGTVSVNIDDIRSIDIFKFVGGAGLLVVADKKYKFGFIKKEDRDQAMAYLQQHLGK